MSALLSRDVLRTRLSYAGWAWFAFLVFGLSVVLLAVDLGFQALLPDVPHRSTLGTIIRVFAKGALDDSWMPMLKALETLRGDHASTLYETLFFAQKVKFQYPPTSLLFLHPLNGYDIPAAIALLNKINFGFYVANAAVVAAIADVLARHSDFYRAQGAHARAFVLAMTFFAALVFHPNAEAVRYGQIQVWIDLAFSLAILAWLFGMRIVAGVLLGLSCAIKPQFALILVWGLLWRDWRFVGGFLAAVVPLGLASLALYGLHNHIAYLKVLSFIAERGESYIANVSVNGLVSRLLFNGSPNLTVSDWAGSDFAPPHAAVLWATRLAFVGFVFVGLKRAIWRTGERPTALDLGVVMLCAVMSSPVAWDHHYGVMMPLYVVAFFYILQDREEMRSSSLFALWLSWALAANYTRMIELLNGTYLNPLQGYLFFAALWLLWFLVRASTPEMSAGASKTKAAL